MSDSEVGAASDATDEIDVGLLISAFWRGKWLILAVTFACVLGAAAVALMLPDVYRAEAVLAPKQEEASGLAGLTSRYSGFAALAGIGLPRGTADKKALGLKILGSREFFSGFMERHSILAPLFAAKEWNRASGELLFDPKIYDARKGQWMRNVKPPLSKIPSAQEAHDEFVEVLSVSEDKDTGFVTVAIEHVSPVIAKQWVEWLVADLNRTILEMDVEEAERAIAYLNEKIAATSLADLRTVFYRLIEEQTKIMMLANVSPEYVFRTIDPAVEPYRPAKPHRILIVAAAGVCGLVSSALSALLLFGRLGGSRPRSRESPTDP